MVGTDGTKARGYLGNALGGRLGPGLGQIYRNEGPLRSEH